MKHVNAVEEDASYSLGKNSFALGEGTKAEGNNAYAEGYYTSAKGNNQHVEGKYNIEDNLNNYVHIIGNGNSQTPSNLHTID
jgi:hypothetical protein